MLTLKNKAIAVFSLFALLMIIITLPLKAQKIFTKNGSISFFSRTNMEDISADNNQVLSVLDTKSGELQFSVIVKNFHFKKALMEEHFNENYMESDKFPKATFKGTISDVAKLNLSADGSYPVTVAGDLTMHGITQKVSSPGTVTVKSGKINGTSKFTVKLADYNISIPSVVKDNISPTIDITVNCDYDQKCKPSYPDIYEIK